MICEIQKVNSLMFFFLAKPLLAKIHHLNRPLLTANKASTTLHDSKKQRSNRQALPLFQSIFVDEVLRSFATTKVKDVFADVLPCLDLKGPVLYEPDEGGQACAGSNHYDRM